MHEAGGRWVGSNKVVEIKKKKKKDRELKEYSGKRLKTLFMSAGKLEDTGRVGGWGVISRLGHFERKSELNSKLNFCLYITRAILKILR